MSERVVIVTGSRYQTDSWPTEHVLNILNPQRVIQGGQRGVDTWAKNWADKNAVPYETYPYLSGLGKAGGPARNRWMVKRGWLYIDKLDDTVLVVHMPGGSGTASMVEIARTSGLFLASQDEVAASTSEDLWSAAVQHYAPVGSRT